MRAMRRQRRGRIGTTATDRLPGFPVDDRPRGVRRSVASIGSRREQSDVRDPGQLARRRERELLAAPSGGAGADRKSTRLNSSHSQISYAVFCLKKKKKKRSGQSTTA